jgi:hypothetical protein
MSFSKVHSCIHQIKVAEERLEPPAAKCRCRRYIAIAKATLMVKNGEASFIVKSRTREPSNEICRLCHGDKEVKNCANCFGSGKERGTIIWEDYGNDIVLVSRPPADKFEKKRSSSLAAKTPRVATIEKNHIELAYVYEVKEAQERIEEYGRLILDARMFIGKDRIPCLKVEPENDAKTGTGRDYDFGRAIL